MPLKLEKQSVTSLFYRNKEWHIFLKIISLLEIDGLKRKKLSKYFP